MTILDNHFELALEKIKQQVKEWDSRFVFQNDFSAYSDFFRIALFQHKHTYLEIKFDCEGDIKYTHLCYDLEELGESVYVDNPSIKTYNLEHLAKNAQFEIDNIKESVKELNKKVKALKKAKNSFKKIIANKV